MPSGILLLNKSEGTRSTDCVARVKRLFKEKTGHAGTLDSTACGLLVMLLGAATRLSDYVMLLPKIYTARVRLGEETDTADASGEIIFSASARGINESDIDSALNNFRGEIMQAPPEISAIKVGGKAAHRIKRSLKGENAENAFSLPERVVHVHEIKRTSPFAACEFEIEVRCGKGTYIRSIARDIGRKLGCGGHVRKLRRLSVGNFSVDDAPGLEGLSLENLLPVESVFAFYDRVTLNAGAESRLSNGLRAPLDEAGEYVAGELGNKHVAVLGEGLFGFAEIRAEGEVLYLYPRVNIRRTGK
ncbi:MAG: tRNA pseudouridine(55) synthase TruB [Synergistaceae bacterium]|nr:tRNA pseudouridine(55) synthase TruB [Synergistaceae bacterium]